MTPPREQKGGFKNSTYPLEILNFWEWFSTVKIAVIVIPEIKKAGLI